MEQDQLSMDGAHCKSVFDLNDNAVQLLLFREIKYSGSTVKGLLRTLCFCQHVDKKSFSNHEFMLF